MTTCARCRKIKMPDENYVGLADGDEKDPKRPLFCLPCIGYVLATPSVRALWQNRETS